MDILQILTEDKDGGAVRVPMYLRGEYKRLSHKVLVCVGRKRTQEEDIVEIPNLKYRNLLFRIIYRFINSGALSFRGGWRIKEFLKFLADPTRQLRIWLGYEDFDFPGTKVLLNLVSKFDILECHNLYGFWLEDGGYFDLRLLPQLTKKIPTVLVVHDMWLFTGHCSYSFGCERWKIGCGKCPDINLAPPIRRDKSSENLAIKKQIYQQSKFWVIVPSRWLYSMVTESVLKDGMIDARIIPNGVDTKLFFPPKDKGELKRKFGFPKDKIIISASGKGIGVSRWVRYYKGIDILMKALEISEKSFYVVLIGGVLENQPQRIERVGNSVVLYLPFTQDHSKVRELLSASDIYCQPSLAENFPLAILEAQACGVVPVASQVGGITDIIEDGKTGFLFEPGNFEELARKLEIISDKPKKLYEISANCIEHARRLDISEQAKNYLLFYEEILKKANKRS